MVLIMGILLLVSSQLSCKTVVTTCWRSPTQAEKRSIRTSSFLYLVSFYHCPLCPSDSCRTCISRTLWPEPLLPDHVETPHLKAQWRLVNSFCPACCPGMTMWVMLFTEGAHWSQIKEMVPTWRMKLMPAACTLIPAILATELAGQTTPWSSPMAVRVSLRVSGGTLAHSRIPQPDSYETQVTWVSGPVTWAYPQWGTGLC